MPTVSVLLSVCNEDEAFLRKAVECVLDQSFDNLELILIDDGDDDETARILNEYDRKHGSVKLLRNHQNLGLTKSLNRGIEHASGTFIARQDADDVSEPARIARQVAYLEEHPSIDVLGTDVRFIDADGRPIGRQSPPSRITRESLVKGNPLVHGSIMFRGKFIRDHGYDEKFKYSQDYELWLRTVDNHVIRCLNEPLYRQRIHLGAIGSTAPGEQYVYGVAARQKHEYRFGEGLISALNRGDFEAALDELSPHERAGVDYRCAKNYLEKGEMKLATEYARRAIIWSGPFFRAFLIYVISIIGRLTPSMAAEVYTGLRNLKNRIAVRTGLWFEISDYDGYSK